MNAPAVPDGLAWWRGVPEGARWLADLPKLAEGCASAWQLTLGAPYEPARIAWVAPAELPDGTRAVLKINFPETETEHEADALAFWNGRGAVRLLAHDAGRRALLLARCEPGDQLWSVEDDDGAVRIAAGVLRTLWRPAPAGGPFLTLADEARRWAQELPARWLRHGEPVAKRLLDEAVGLAEELRCSQAELVLCHQDAHGGNILLAGETWLAIDPKPLVGERAFDLASALRDRRYTLLAAPDPERIVARRLDGFAGELGLDRGRLRGWGIIHALVWGLSDDHIDRDLLACAELLAAS